MTHVLGNHSVLSAARRMLHLVRSFGVGKALSVGVATFDDQWLKLFDRQYGVRTSGYISLASTSIDRAKLRDATSYGAVNAWAFRWLLKTLQLPRSSRFVDLGCGLGRACILAAEYGFERVTGVELAPELCATARENIATCRSRTFTPSSVSIVNGDVLDYCENTDDDVFFIYRAFSLSLFVTVIKELTERAALRSKPITIIYTERLYAGESNCAKVLGMNSALHRQFIGDRFGQAFFVYQCPGRGQL